jgi:hypothetical protein
MEAESLIKFYRAIPECRLPIRADRSALGTIPVAAYKHCEALTTASGLGWYVFSPLDFTVQWDGAEVIWTYEGEDAWFPLTSAQYPGFADFFDRNAPESVRGYAPSFLASTAIPGLLQVWTGLFVKTAPDWSLHVRPLANLPVNRNYELYEGIVETDRWFGPLFINLRLSRQDHPISFTTELPLFQVQVLPRVAYLEESMKRCAIVEEPLALTAADWDAFATTIVKPNANPHRPLADYAVRTRKRARV